MDADPSELGGPYESVGFVRLPGVLWLFSFERYESLDAADDWADGGPYESLGDDDEVIAKLFPNEFTGGPYESFGFVGKSPPPAPPELDGGKYALDEPD